VPRVQDEAIHEHGRAKDAWKCVGGRNPKLVDGRGVMRGCLNDELNIFMHNSCNCLASNDTDRAV
jgi:hypothetical protein